MYKCTGFYSKLAAMVTKKVYYFEIYLKGNCTCTTSRGRRPPVPHSWWRQWMVPFPITFNNPNARFQLVTIYWNNSKMVQDTAIVTTVVVCDVPIGIIFNELERPVTDFKVTPIFDAEYLSNGTRCGHSYNGKRIWTSMRSVKWCHFQWLWVTRYDILQVQITRKCYGALRTMAECYFSQIVRSIRAANRPTVLYVVTD